MGKILDRFLNIIKLSMDLVAAYYSYQERLKDILKPNLDQKIVIVKEAPSKTSLQVREEQKAKALKHYSEMTKDIPQLVPKRKERGKNLGQKKNLTIKPKTIESSKIKNNIKSGKAKLKIVDEKSKSQVKHRNDKMFLEKKEQQKLALAKNRESFLKERMRKNIEMKEKKAKEDQDKEIRKREEQQTKSKEEFIRKKEEARKKREEERRNKEQEKNIIFNLGKDLRSR